MATASRLPCPYLQAEIELADNREQHIAERHPELLPAHRAALVRAVHDPDSVRLSKRFAGARLFTRYEANVLGGEQVVVVVVSEPRRHWIITAYVAARLTEGSIEWSRS